MNHSSPVSGTCSDCGATGEMRQSIHDSLNRQTFRLCAGCYDSRRAKGDDPIAYLKQLVAADRWGRAHPAEGRSSPDGA